MMEDDRRSFWVFTYACGCTTGVLTDGGYDQRKAFREMYGSAREGWRAVERGVRAELVDAQAYHAVYYEKIKRGHVCGA